MGREMPGLCLGSWKHTSKVMVEVFVSWCSDDCFTKTANLEETDTGDDSSDTRETTNPKMELRLSTSLERHRNSRDIFWV